VLSGSPDCVAAGAHSPVPMAGQLLILVRDPHERCQRNAAAWLLRHAQGGELFLLWNRWVKAGKKHSILDGMTPPPAQPRARRSGSLSGARAMRARFLLMSAWRCSTDARERSPSGGVPTK